MRMSGSSKVSPWYFRADGRTDPEEGQTWITFARMLNSLRVPRIKSQILHLFSRIPPLIRSSEMRRFWNGADESEGGGAWSPISDTLSLLNISRISVRHNSRSCAVSGKPARRYQFSLYSDEAPQRERGRIITRGLWRPNKPTRADFVAGIATTTDAYERARARAWTWS